MTHSARRIGRKKKATRRVWLYLGGIAGVVVVVAYFLLFAPFLRLHTVEVSSSVNLRHSIETLVRQELEGRRVFGLVSNSRYAFFNSARVENLIASSLASVADVVVRANLSGVIRVDVEERIPYGIVCRTAVPVVEQGESVAVDRDEEDAPLQGGDDIQGAEGGEERPDLQPFRVLEQSVVGSCIYFDERGVLYEEAPRTRGSLIVGLYIGDDVSFDLGKPPLSDAVMQWFLAVVETLKAQSAIQVTRFYVPRVPVGTVYVETAEGWWVAMNALGDHLRQLRSVVAILEEVITTDRRATLRYIDVRVPGRAFYK